MEKAKQHQLFELEIDRFGLITHCNSTFSEFISTHFNRDYRSLASINALIDKNPRIFPPSEHDIRNHGKSSSINDTLEFENEFFGYLGPDVDGISHPCWFYRISEESNGKSRLVGQKSGRIDALRREYHHNFPIPFIILNPTGFLVFVSSSFSGLMGRPRRELIGIEFISLLHERSTEKFIEYLKSGATMMAPIEKHASDSIKTFLATDGAPLRIQLVPDVNSIESVIPVEILPRILKQNDNYSIACSVHDLSRQKIALNKVFKSFDNTPHPIFRYSNFANSTDIHDEYRFTYVNDAFAKYLEYDSADEVIGMSIFSIFHEDDFDDIYRKVQDRFRLCQVETTYSYFIKTKTGATRKVLIQAFPFVYDASYPAFVQGALYDLTEEVQNVNEIESRNRKLEAMIKCADAANNFPVAEEFIDFIMEEIVTFCGGIGSMLLEYHSLGKDSSLVLTHSHGLSKLSHGRLELKGMGNSCDGLLSTLDGGYASSKEISILSTVYTDEFYDPEEIDIYFITLTRQEVLLGDLMLIIPKGDKLDDAEETIFKYASSLVSTKLNQLRLSEEEEFMKTQMEAVSKQITLAEIAWEITHEVGNAINAISLKNLVALRSGATKKDRETKEHLEGINTKIVDAECLIRQFKDWYSGSSDHDMSYDIFDVVNEVISVHRLNQRVKSGNVSIVLRNDLRGHTLSISKIRITQVLNNIVINAIQAIPKSRKGTVHIKTSRTDDEVCVMVIDNGSGIRHEDFGKIFNKYTTKSDGTGFGLFISKRFIDEAGGHIEFRNNSTPPGATFEIHVPFTSIGGKA